MKNGSFLETMQHILHRLCKEHETLRHWNEYDGFNAHDDEVLCTFLNAANEAVENLLKGKEKTYQVFYTSDYDARVLSEQDTLYAALGRGFFYLTHNCKNAAVPAVVPMERADGFILKGDPEAREEIWIHANEEEA